MKYLMAAALLAASAGAQAAPSTWTFSYTGFYDQYLGEWRPDRQLTGSFRGEDIDRDGKLVLSELTALNVNGDFIPCPDDIGIPFSCTVQSFSYSQGGLEFTGYTFMHDEAVSWTHFYDLGKQYSQYTSNPTGTGEYTIEWTADTKFSINGPTLPVPESSQALLLAAGLAGLGGVRALKRGRRAGRGAAR